MTEMQYTSTDEAFDFLRKQLILATELTNELMEQVHGLQPDNSGPVPGLDGKVAKRPILRVIEGGLSKNKALSPPTTRPCSDGLK